VFELAVAFGADADHGGHDRAGYGRLFRVKLRLLFADGAGVIGEGCLVGGADFAQFGASCLDNFTDSKSAADLDQFATRDHYLRALTPFCEMVNN